MYRMASGDRSYLPECWNDDQRMNLLFVEFRNRNVNPDGWASKMKFWSDLIQIWSRKTGTLIFTPEDVSCAFLRNGKTPSCLKTVLGELESKLVIVPASEFIKNLENTSWVSWGLDYLVKKPLSWSVSSVMGALNWAPSQQTNYICVPVLKELGEEVIKRHQEQVTSEWLDHCLLEDTLWQECCDLIPDRRSFEIVLLYLRKEGKVSLMAYNDQEKVVKFRRKDETKPPVITEVDMGVLKLQSAKETLENEIEELHSKILSFKDEASAALNSGNRTKAKMVLAKKQRIEKDMQKKEMSLFNIDSLLTKLRESDSQKKVIAAYETGVEALKKATKTISFDKIDSTMAEMEEAFDLAKDVQDEISKPFPWMEQDAKELEEELDRMLLEDEEAHMQAQPQPSSEEEELTKLLEKLGMPEENEPTVTRKPSQDFENKLVSLPS